MARKPPSPDDESATPAFSRRSFLKTAGVGAAATTVVGVGAKGEAAQVLGPDAVTLSLTVNGSVQQVSVEPRVTLLDALRNHLDLTGAKPIDLGQYARAKQALGGAVPSIDSVRARVALLAGRVERALGGSGERHFNEALATLGERGDLYMRMLALIDAALVLPPVDAAAQCLGVQRLAEESEYHGIEAKAYLQRARHLLRAGEVQFAAASLRKTPSHLAGVRAADTYAAEAGWIAYEVFAADGDGRAALEALRRAVDWIRHTAVPNVPEEFRDSFLNLNPVNRALLTTW